MLRTAVARIVILARTRNPALTISTTADKVVT